MAPAAVRLGWLIIVLALTAVCAGCGRTLASPAAASGASPSGGQGEVTVLAAASLTESFTAIAEDFEAATPGVRVRLSFGASSTLAEQVRAKAPADVFAAASEATVRPVTDAGLAEQPPRIFARNALEIAVPAGNPGRVRGLADLARPELKIALCAPQVPCGSAAGAALAAAGVRAAPDTVESDVKAVLTKVSLGEVDAGLVYRSDVQAGGPKVQGIAFPEARQAVNSYPIVVIKDAPNQPAGRAFVDWVLSSRGRDALVRVGFETP